MIPGSGRFPEGGNGNPLQYSCLGNPMDRRAWWAREELHEAEHTYKISMLRDKRRTWNTCKEKSTKQEKRQVWRELPRTFKNEKQGLPWWSSG